MSSTVRLVNDVGEVKEIVYSLPPKEAITNAVYQYVLDRWDTWNYGDVSLIEHEDKYIYLFGRNSMLWVRKG